MRAIVLSGGQYRLEECERPKPGPGEIGIRVACAGVNRADLLQKQGRYPLPGHRPAVPGMEISGIVEACGAHVQGLHPGDRVCTLMQEGAFAEYAVAPAAQMLPVPGGMTLEEAAALPEACFTVWISLVWQAKLRRGETVLIHGGASGIGTIGIQMAVLLGARVFATCGTEEKRLLCERLGAERAYNYREEDFTEAMKAATGGKGVDVILDMVGGDYFERNLNTLAHNGRLALIAFLKGAKVNANLAPVLLKHLSIMGSTLRPRPIAEKAAIAAELQRSVWKEAASGRLKPVIDRVFPLKEAEKALLRMDQGLNVGKILLKI